MKINSDKTQIILDAGQAIDVGVTDTELGVRALVGYHNYAGIGLSEATDIVQKCADEAGLDYYATNGCNAAGIPQQAIRVGQVRVHPHDGAYPLYVVKRNK